MTSSEMATHPEMLPEMEEKALHMEQPEHQPFELLRLAVEGTHGLLLGAADCLWVTQFAVWLHFTRQYQHGLFLRFSPGQSIH